MLALLNMGKSVRDGFSMTGSAISHTLTIAIGLRYHWHCYGYDTRGSEKPASADQDQSSKSSSLLDSMITSPSSCSR